MRHRTRQSSPAALDAAGDLYQARTVTGLLELGAVVFERNSAAVSLQIMTPVGLLTIHACKFYVHSAFRDSQAGHAYTASHALYNTSNPYSGKWNFYLISPNSAPSVIWEAQWTSYVRQVEKLMRYDPKTGKVIDAKEAAQESGAGPSAGVRAGEDPPPVEDAEYIDE